MYNVEQLIIAVLCFACVAVIYIAYNVCADLKANHKKEINRLEFRIFELNVLNTRLSTENARLRVDIPEQKKDKVETEKTGIWWLDAIIALYGIARAGSEEKKFKPRFYEKHFVTKYIAPASRETATHVFNESQIVEYIYKMAGVRLDGRRIGKILRSEGFVKFQQKSYTSELPEWVYAVKILQQKGGQDNG